MPHLAHSPGWPWTLPVVGRHADRSNSEHPTSPDGQPLTQHQTPVVVALVELRPAATEAVTDAHPPVHLAAHPPSDPRGPPGCPPAQSTPQSTELAPLAVMSALQSAVPAQLPSDSVPSTILSATLFAKSALQAASSIAKSVESAPALGCVSSGVPVDKVHSHPEYVHTHTKHTECVTGNHGQCSLSIPDA